VARIALLVVAIQDRLLFTIVRDPDRAFLWESRSFSTSQRRQGRVKPVYRSALFDAFGIALRILTVTFQAGIISGRYHTLHPGADPARLRDFSPPPKNLALFLLSAARRAAATKLFAATEAERVLWLPNKEGASSVLWPGRSG
jgi:hypothetical protein